MSATRRVVPATIAAIRAGAAAGRRNADLAVEFGLCERAIYKIVHHLVWTQTGPDGLPRPNSQDQRWARVSPATRAAIRARYTAGGMRQEALAREYGLSMHTLDRILRDLIPPRAQTERPTRLSAAQAADVCARYATGTTTYRALAEEFQVSHSVIWRAVHQLTHSLTIPGPGPNGREDPACR